MIIFGVDPSCCKCGVSVVEVDQSSRIKILICDTLCLPSRMPLQDRLAQLHDRFTGFIHECRPHCIALETPFLGKNAQQFLKLGYVRGILYVLASQHELLLREFAPREVKAAITGYGGATKEQVATVLGHLFPHMVKPERFDATDSLAVALCAAFMLR